MALPNLSALVPLTGQGEGEAEANPNRRVGFQDPPPPARNGDGDGDCVFKVCMNSNKLSYDFRNKELLYGEEVLSRYETALPKDFIMEMIQNDEEETVKEQWSTVPYYRGGDRWTAREYVHGELFRKEFAHQKLIQKHVGGVDEVGVRWEAEDEAKAAPHKHWLNYTLWMETLPGECAPPERRYCLITMVVWAHRLAYMTPEARSEHRRGALLDGYCQVLAKAYRLYDTRYTTGLKGRPGWVGDATLAVWLLERYRPVLRAVTREWAGGAAAADLEDAVVDELLYDLALCKAKDPAADGRREQVRAIPKLIAALRERAAEMRKEHRAEARGVHLDRSDPTDPDSVKEAAEAEKNKQDNQSRNEADHSP